MRTPEQIQAELHQLPFGHSLDLTQVEYLKWSMTEARCPPGRSIRVIKEAPMNTEKPASPVNPVTPQDVNSTLNDRAKTHGSFIDNGRIMQNLKLTMREDGKNWNELHPYQREALEMIQHKIGRILSGNPDEPDHWRDIAGYATLVENILTTGQSHIPATTK